MTALDNDLRYSNAHRVRDGVHTIRIVRRDGSVVAEWPEANLQSIMFELNAPGSARITFPIDSERGQILRLVDDEIQILRNGELLWWGVPWRLSGNNEMSLECEGLKSYFNTRYLTYTSLEYEDMEQFSIAFNLVSHAQGQTIYSDLNITAANWTPSGKNRYRLYRRADHPNILQLLEEFHDLKDGFDTSIESDLAGNRVWTPHFPQKGSFKGGQRLEWGRNVIGIKNYSEDGLYMARQVYVTGGTSGDVRFEANGLATGLDLDDVMTTMIISDGQTLDVDWLQDRVDEELANRTKPLVQPQLVVSNDPTSLIDGVEVGDTVPVKVKIGRVQLEGNYRIRALTYYPNQVCDVQLEEAA